MTKLRTQRKCPFCHKEIIDLGEFNDSISLKEYQISGLCQKCQDQFFD